MTDDLQPAGPRLSPEREFAPPVVGDPLANQPKEDSMMKRLFGASWRTTLFGYLVAGGQFAWDAYQSGGVTLKGAVVSALIAVAGRIVKDSKVTGIGDKATSKETLDATRVGPNPTK